MNSPSFLPDPLNYEDYLILVVDDNNTNLSVVADFLEEIGFDVMVASDGHSGLTRAQQSLPDLILSDVMMPVMDGFEMCRHLKADPTTAPIPVIFMTALSETESKVTGFEAGSVDYVTKPIQHEEVLARVITHLRLRNLMLQLWQVSQELTRRNEEKDKFFSIVAHDLRGPFQPLLGMSKFLAETATISTPADIYEMSQSIYRSANNVFTLLENLLQWSRLRRQKIEFEPESVLLTEVVSDVFDLLNEIAQNKRISLYNKVASPTLVKADKHMLHTIIRNLISNALKFTPDGGHVTLQAKINPEAVTIAVTDTGIGIAPQNINHLFNLNENHTTLGTNQEKGTGLGLIICQEMVKKHGGRIWLESQLGQGTTIYFTLPSTQEFKVGLDRPKEHLARW